MVNKNSLNVNDRFGKLTVIRWHYTDDKYQKFWLCRCDCGQEVIVRQQTLVRPNGTQSCGCNRRGHPGQYLAKEEGWKVTARRVFRKYRDGDLTLEEFIKQSQKPCHYCGLVLSNRFNPYMKYDGSTRNDQNVTPKRISEMWWTYNGLDRINSLLPHLKSNCVPCCKTCNLMKSNMSPEEFREHCRKVVMHG